MISGVKTGPDLSWCTHPAADKNGRANVLLKPLVVQHLRAFDAHWDKGLFLKPRDHFSRRSGCRLVSLLDWNETTLGHLPSWTELNLAAWLVSAPISSRQEVSTIITFPPTRLGHFWLRDFQNCPLISRCHHGVEKGHRGCHLDTICARNHPTSVSSPYLWEQSRRIVTSVSYCLNLNCPCVPFNAHQIENRKQRNGGAFHLPVRGFSFQPAEKRGC